MKIIPSTTQELPDDSSDSDKEVETKKGGGTSETKKTAAAGRQSGSASLIQQPGRQGFPSPMAQSLLFSQNQASRLPNALLQQTRQLRQLPAAGHGHPYDLVASQLQQPFGVPTPQLFGANPLLGQSSLMGASNPMHGSGLHNSSISNTFVPTPFSGFSADISSAAMLRAAQLQQQQEQQGFSAYLQALRSAEGGAQESVLSGQQSQLSQLAAMQARLRGTTSTSDETLRLAQLTEQIRQGDPATRLQMSQQQQQQQQASLLSQQQGQQGSSLLPQQQLLLNATLEREQVNAQIQALRQQMQRRQEGGEHPADGDPPVEGS